MCETQSKYLNPLRNHSPAEIIFWNACLLRDATTTVDFLTKNVVGIAPPTIIDST